MEEPQRKFMNKYSDKEVVDGFFTSWSGGDPDDIKSSLYALIKRFGGTHLAASTGIPRTTLYDMCRDSSNPTLENLCLVINFLKSQRVA